ncbi:MAG: hypothetical protein A2857_06015 [Candidatus Levybacteria bacterium RIFCSPHIGHO2_01_FULL_36_15]|nr:MAG: hypothetical protein A2857_06015 [Candidatus Levybacteria bacterium RIFCSPHIGHO2_01_FULL_36_15]OGH37541.1 MAG: hypothetical protein A2905_01220 [Candidatus Levybacteria bacterium RIFCSPLOWO2_01_FULL_36_10]
MKNILNEIYRSMGKFLVPLTLEQTYKIIVQEGAKLTDATYGSILLRKSNGFIRVYSSLPISQQVIPRKRGYAYQTYKLKGIILVNRNQVIRYHPEYKKTNMQSLIFIPLSYGKQSLGILSLQFNQERTFTQEQLRILDIFGSLASLAIRKMQYYNQTKIALENRDLFISLASHEFKTPLTSIKIYAELIGKNLDKNMVIDKEWVKNLLLSVKRLTDLTDEFLQIDQIKKGKLKYYWSQQNLDKILKQTISDFKLLYPDYIISYRNYLKDRSCLIIADPDKLLEAIANLLNNAVKFSRKGSKIEVLLKKIGSNFVIAIKDQGIGIDKEDLPKIFNRFYRGTASKSGMGLGLYLTRQIITKHHGTISARSKLNKGTTFIITLPVKNYAK